MTNQKAGDLLAKGKTRNGLTVVAYRDGECVAKDACRVEFGSISCGVDCHREAVALVSILERSYLFSRWAG